MIPFWLITLLFSVKGKSHFFPNIKTAGRSHVVRSHRVISVRNKGRLLENVMQRPAVTVPTSAITVVVVIVVVVAITVVMVFTRCGFDLCVDPIVASQVETFAQKTLLRPNLTLCRQAATSGPSSSIN